MTNAQPRNLGLLQPGRYNLPTDLRFISLVASQGTEIIRIRFSRGPATILDLPLSAATLADLVQFLCPLHGHTKEEMPEEIEFFGNKEGFTRTRSRVSEGHAR